MNVLDDPLVKRFLDNRGLSKSSITKYERVLRFYCEFIKMTPSQFIDEAEKEEEKRLRMRKRKISDYIPDWKIHLTEKGYKTQTINMYITGLKTFYADNDIELPRLKLKSAVKKYKPLKRIKVNLPIKVGVNLIGHL